MADLGVTELCRVLDLKPHVLRYWEQTIPLIAPRYDDSGRKRYNEAQVRLLMRVKHLVLTRGMATNAVADHLIAESSGPAAGLKARVEAARAALIDALLHLRVQPTPTQPPARENAKTASAAAQPILASSLFAVDMSALRLERIPAGESFGACPLTRVLEQHGVSLLQLCLRSLRDPFIPAHGVSRVTLAVSAEHAGAVRKTSADAAHAEGLNPAQVQVVGVDSEVDGIRCTPSAALYYWLCNLFDSPSGNVPETVVLYDGYRPRALRSALALMGPAHDLGSVARVTRLAGRLYWDGALIISRGGFTRWRSHVETRVRRICAPVLNGRLPNTDNTGKQWVADVRWSDWGGGAQALHVSPWRAPVPLRTAPRWPREVGLLWQEDTADGSSVR